MSRRVVSLEHVSACGSTAARRTQRHARAAETGACELRAVDVFVTLQQRDQLIQSGRGNFVVCAEALVGCVHELPERSSVDTCRGPKDTCVFADDMSCALSPRIR